ncbi:MAG: DUF2269 family protein [Gammaproteobacteria bacterium]|nr:DUF2269 family protein [Gammaproteobacteria bacterium]
MTAEIYLSLKWLHIASACIGFGSNVTHIFWLLAANADPVHRSNILRLIKKIDDRLAVPAYVVTTICGTVMWLALWPTNTPWIIVSLVVTLVLAAMGTAYGPFMKRWIRLTALQQAEQRQIAGLSRVLTTAWIGITVSVFAVLYLMVWKPVLW